MYRMEVGHAEEVKKLQRQFEEDLEQRRESLKRDNEQRLASFRKELAAEQLVEEQQLRAQKEDALNSLRAKVSWGGWIKLIVVDILRYLLLLYYS